MNNENIGSRIHETRKKVGVSQKKMAQSLGIKPSLLSMIENGRRPLKANQLYIICKELDASADYILGLREINIKPSDFDEVYQEIKQDFDKKTEKLRVKQQEIINNIRQVLNIDNDK